MALTAVQRAEALFSLYAEDGKVPQGDDFIKIQGLEGELQALSFQEWVSTFELEEREFLCQAFPSLEDEPQISGHEGEIRP